ncbi:hypothetical protein V1477_014734 [Vespula maculifrons]|uniref:Uncharacterized protein n=1 Tax=Vespula maculifrons TaxID=7453 RepID=A0ABD2BIA0_VESMC
MDCKIASLAYKTTSLTITLKGLEKGIIDFLNHLKTSDPLCIILFNLKEKKKDLKYLSTSRKD